jgi:hypothetical protein
MLNYNCFLHNFRKEFQTKPAKYFLLWPDKIHLEAQQKGYVLQFICFIRNLQQNNLGIIWILSDKNTNIFAKLINPKLLFWQKNYNIEKFFPLKNCVL